MPIGVPYTHAIGLILQQAAEVAGFEGRWAGRSCKYRRQLTAAIYKLQQNTKFILLL